MNRRAYPPCSGSIPSHGLTEPFSRTHASLGRDLRLRTVKPARSPFANTVELLGITRCHVVSIRFGEEIRLVLSLETGGKFDGPGPLSARTHV